VTAEDAAPPAGDDAPRARRAARRRRTGETDVKAFEPSVDQGTDAAVEPEREVEPPPAVEPDAAQPGWDRGDPGSGNLAIGIDFGGSGIKAAAVDVDRGVLVTERFREKTPSPSTPRACLKVIQDLVAQIMAAVPISATAPVGMGMPAVILHGAPVTAVNIDDAWLGFAAAEALHDALGRPARVVNDADAAGVGEMLFGAGRGHRGTVVLITLGTGVGSALFRDGRLLPNTELGHIEVRGKDAELRASAASRERRKLSWVAYAGELDEYLHKLDMLVWPDLIIIGGGISKDAARFVPRLTVRPPVIPAANRNNAGILGAAVLASELVVARPSATELAEQG
jgi:polyphosphate glucokinase